MSKQSEFTKCLMSQLEGYRKKIHGENFSPRQKELFPSLKRDLNMEIEDAARSDDPLEACMERRGYKPSKTQVFQDAIAAKMTADMFGKQEKLTGAEAMFQEQMQECLDRLKNRPKLKFGAAPTGTEIYMQDSPISKELQHRFEQTTFYEYDMNKEFNDSVSARENEVIEALKKYGITEIPEDVQTALAYYRKSLYNWLITKANQVPGPMITGPSNYNYNKLNKSIAREDKAMESLDTAKEHIRKAVNRVVKVKSSGRRGIPQQTIDDWLVKATHTPRRKFGEEFYLSVYEKAHPNLKEMYDRGVYVSSVKDQGRKLHKRLVEIAIEEDDPISEEAKKDYPELFGKEKPKRETATSKLIDYEKAEKAKKEFIAKQEENERIVEEWKKEARERREAEKKALKDEAEESYQAVLKKKKKTIPEQTDFINPSQMTLFGRMIAKKLAIQRKG